MGPLYILSLLYIFHPSGKREGSFPGSLLMFAYDASCQLLMKTFLFIYDEFYF